MDFTVFLGFSGFSGILGFLGSVGLFGSLDFGPLLECRGMNLSGSIHGDFGIDFFFVRSLYLFRVEGQGSKS